MQYVGYQMSLTSLFCTSYTDSLPTPKSGLTKLNVQGLFYSVYVSDILHHSDC